MTNNIYYTSDHLLVETPTTTWGILETTFDRKFPTIGIDDLRSLPDSFFEEHIVSYGSPKGFFEIDRPEAFL